MIATLIALVLAFTGQATAPAPTAAATSDEFAEVPILPEAAYEIPSLCVPVVLDETATQEAIDYLRGQGWTGRDDDGMEALYAPGC